MRWCLLTWWYTSFTLGWHLSHIPQGHALPHTYLPKFKYDYYLREVGERESAPKLISPFPKAAQDTACDPVARKCALQRLHAHERKAAKCAWDMSLFFQGSFSPSSPHAAVEAKLLAIEADTKARALAGQDFKRYEFKGRRRRGKRRSCVLTLQPPLSQGPEPRGLSRLETLSVFKSH